MSTHPAATRLVAAIGLLAMTLSGCGDDRPGLNEWRADWVAQRDGFPTADVLLEGGEDECGAILGRLRGELDALTPTPAEELDEVVAEWTAHAESIVFDCPDDPDELTSRLDQLRVLAAEVDAGLRAEAGGT